MPKNHSREEQMKDAFLVLGSQYYVHARYSAERFYLPVCVTLFHHAIEMLLKGFLSMSTSSNELRRIGHNLIALWELFKTTTSNIELSRFDITISRLNQIESLRYPDIIVDEGYVLNVRYGSPTPPLDLPGTEGLKQYFVDVSELDEIVTVIFDECKVSTTPYFKNAPTELKVALPSTLYPKD